MMNRVFPWSGETNDVGSREDENQKSSSEAGISGSLTEMLSQPDTLLRQHPLVTVGIGLCAGVAIGWWVKRR